ncbi:heterokaryon incompatibility protein-domain-containing protein [Biscogniauxia mediterranea]|nr:heterokaryon incompatibility protein-domain-containing protein [Biscogniauxia mediterranea]
MDRWNLEVAPLLYLPLDDYLSFRLLVIHPGLLDEPLRTELIMTTLDESENRYEATSYTWGSAEGPLYITCNGFQLRIQRNAFDMLRDLRLPDEPRKVWIDAVCIDQSSLSERAAQVSIMHRIYKRAKAVVVWLGQADEHSSVAMEYAATLDTEKYMREFIASYDKGLYSNWIGSKQKTCFFDLELNSKEEEEHFKYLAASLVSFLNRPWFSRIWVQQEAALCSNTKVICGLKAVDWDNILSLAWIMEPRKTETWPGFTTYNMNNTINNIQAVKGIQRVRRKYFQHIYGQTEGMLSFEALVANSSRYGATDPRDRVYALRNVTTDSEEWISVDYRTPWEIVYADLAQRFLRNGGHMFLQNAGKSRHEPDTVLPSWVPDYRHSRWMETTIICHPLWRAGGRSINALTRLSCMRTAVQPLPKHHRKSLQMMGDLRDFKSPRKILLQSYASIKCLMSDEIVYIGGVIDSETDDFLSDIQSYVDITGQDLDYIRTLKPQTYFNGESLLDAYKLTLILSSDHEQELVGSEYVRDHWDGWISWLEQGSPDYGGAGGQTPVLNYSFESSAAMRYFRFAITKHGYFCLVPRLAQLHDEVSIFQAYELGVVTRPWTPPARTRKSDVSQNKANNEARQTTPTEYFELIGDAYIHGMMNNEARCINDEFNCKYKPTQTQWRKILEASDSGRGEQWRTLDLHGEYSRILPTLGPRTVNLV